MQAPHKQVALFVTCLVDMFRPSIAAAGIKLLSVCGYEVETPRAQTCCGQPGYNSGNLNMARQVAEYTIKCLEPYKQVIVPSGSCAGMIKRHYPALFPKESPNHRRAQNLADKTWELTSFLAGPAALGNKDYQAAPPTEPLGYHYSCSSLRDLGIKREPLELLQQCCGVQPEDMSQAETCCGFGGAFCVKYPRISGRMADDKLSAALAAEVGTITAADMGCLLQLSGRAKRRGYKLSFYHISELLAGQAHPPSI